MRKYQTLPVHNAPCNEIFHKLQDCHYEHPYRRFIGACSDIQKQMQTCIAKQLELNREKNNQASKEKLKRMHSKKEESNQSE